MALCLLTISLNSVASHAVVDLKTGQINPSDVASLRESFKKKANSGVNSFEQSRHSRKKPVEFIPDELIVKFKPRVEGETEAKKAKRHADLHSRRGSKKIREFKKFDMDKVKIRTGLTVEQAISEYKTDPDVEYAEPNFIYHANVVPDDHLFDKLWGMTRIKAPQAWDRTTGSNDVVVAIIDTGVDYNHPDLAANMWVNTVELNGTPGVDNDGNGIIGDIHGMNAIDGSGDPMDDHFHGTHVAGTIGAVSNNTIGVAGVNWNIKIIACKFLDSTGSGSTSDALECMQYLKKLKDSGVNLVAINNSWGGGGYSSALDYAIAAMPDVLFIAAAGNETNNNDTNPHYPSNYNQPNVISVAALAQDEKLAYFSNFGKETVHVTAPGVNIASTYPLALAADPNNAYVYLSGTSMATPHVTGLAALLKAQDPGRDWRAIKNLLYSSGEAVGTLADKSLTGRLINADTATNCTDSPLFKLLQYPKNVVPGVTQTIRVMSLNCAAAAGPVTMNIEGFGPIVLTDDGLNGDTLANDGIFSGRWTPPDYTAREMTVTAPTGSTTVEVSIVTMDNPTADFPVVVATDVNSFIMPAGGPVSFTLTGKYGSAPYSWSIAKGELPAGLGLTAASGLISGTPSGNSNNIITFRVTDAKGFSVDKDWTLVVSEGLVPGWPKSIGKPAETMQPVLVADLYGNGQKSMIITNQEMTDTNSFSGINVVDMNGLVASRGLPANTTVSASVIADLDGDGIQEIIVTWTVISTSKVGGYSLPVRVMNPDLTNKAGFNPATITYPNGGYIPLFSGTPTVADINGDGKLEIIFYACDVYTEEIKVYAVDHTGSILPNWPITFPYKKIYFSSNTAGWAGSSSRAFSTADIDNDGRPEILLADQTGIMRIMHGDGSQTVWRYAPELPPLHSISAKPVLSADLDNDGIPEIIVSYQVDGPYSAQGGPGENYSSTSFIRIFRTDGTEITSGWPVQSATRSFGAPLAADVDGDGQLEVIFMSDGYFAPNQVSGLEARRLDGSSPSGWPRTLPYGGSSPLIADINGDGRQELLFRSTEWSGDTFLNGFSSDGKPLPGFPKLFPHCLDYYFFADGTMYAPPTVADLAGDGRPYIIGNGSDGRIYLWQTPQTGIVAQPELPWPVAGHDNMQSNAVPPNQPGSTAVIAPLTTPTSSQSQLIHGSRPAGNTVNVTVFPATVTVGAVSYPGTTTWECLLENLPEGKAIIIVTCNGNTQVFNISVQTTPPVVPAAVTPESTSDQFSPTIGMTGEIIWLNDGYALSNVRGRLTGEADTFNSWDLKANNLGDVVGVMWDEANQVNQIVGIVNGVKTAFTTDLIEHLAPAINDRGEVVWARYDSTTGKNQIYSSMRGQLTFDPVEHRNPAINSLGDLVWEQDVFYTASYSESKIFGLIDGHLQRFTLGDGFFYTPSINDRREVVWTTQDLNGHYRIFSNSVEGQLTFDNGQPGLVHGKPNYNSCGDLVYAAETPGEGFPLIYRLNSNTPCGTEPEPNNSKELSTTLAHGDVIVGTVAATGDSEDWYAVTLSPWDTLRVRANFGPQTRPAIELRNAAGEVAATLPPGAASFGYQIPAAGTWYLKISTTAETRSGYAIGISITAGSGAEPLPLPPVNTTIAAPAVAGQLSLSWEAPADPAVHHYRIYRSTVAADAGQVIADNLGVLTYTDSTVASATTYYYTVRSVSSSGRESSNTVQVSATSLYFLNYTISGNCGRPHAFLTYTDGFDTNGVLASASGSYTITVPAGWSGTVTPEFSGYAFTPTSRNYTSVNANLTGQDYSAAMTGFTISGNAGTPGAILSYTDDTAKTVTADAGGNYSLHVPNGWTGRVTPVKAHYLFVPPYRDYSNLQWNSNDENYSAALETNVISGHIADCDGYTLPGMTLEYTTDTTRSVVADDKGNYLIEVPYGWSGTVTPKLFGYMFNPPSRSYSNFSTPQPGQNFTFYMDNSALYTYDGFDPGPNGAVRAAALQDDGSIIIGGSFNSLSFGAISRNHLARLRTDSSTDPDFNPNVDADVYAVALQSDGRILIGGQFTTIGGIGSSSSLLRYHLARLNPDGSPDNFFNPNINGDVQTISIQPDGRILVGGSFTTVGSSSRTNLVRLNSDGTVDGSFNPAPNGPIDSILLQGNGDILIGGGFTVLGGSVSRNYLARLHPDGSLDSAFNPDPNGTVRAIALQADGNILIGGDFTTLSAGATGRNYLARLSASGVVDAAFNPDPSAAIYAITVQSDGRIVIGGDFTTLSGGTVERSYAARLNSDGTVDPALIPSGTARVLLILQQPDDKIIIGGEDLNFIPLARYYSVGEIDYYPFGAGIMNGVTTAIAQPDNRTLAGGLMSTTVDVNETPVDFSNLINIRGDSSINTGFNPTPNGAVNAIAQQPDGKIIIGGAFTTVKATTRNRAARINSDGALDTTFNPNVSGGTAPMVNAVAVQADGKVILVGAFTSVKATTRNRIARVSGTDSTVDTTFNPNANNTVYAVALQTDGKVIIGGAFTSVKATTRNRLARVSGTDAALDTGFNPNINGTVYSVAIQADGKILIGGSFTTVGSSTRNNLARINSDGSLDATFDPGITGGTTPTVSSISLQADGTIIIGGDFTTVAGETRINIARLSADGVLDPTFNTQMDARIYGVTVQPDGKYLITGAFEKMEYDFTAGYGLSRMKSWSAALQTLTASSDGSTVTWLRSGTAPEVSRVTFESSVDMITWSALGNGTRISGGWQLTGQTLPLNQNIYLRARGITTGGNYNGSQSLVEAIRLVYLPTPPAAPVATAATGITASGFTAHWNPSFGAMGYKLDVALDSEFNNPVSGYSNLDVADVTTIPITGLTHGTSYFFRVLAYNLGGAGSFSNTIPVTTLVQSWMLSLKNISDTGSNLVTITSNLQGSTPVSVYPGLYASNFLHNSIVTLTAVPDSENYLFFNNWVGDCDVKTGKQCSVTMNANKAIDANFNLAPVANITSRKPYISLADALTAPAQSGDEIWMLDKVLGDGTAITVNQSLDIKGGWTTYQNNKSIQPSTLDGGMIIQGGNSTVEDVTVKGILIVKGGSLRVSTVRVHP
jgi:uncharacterized delta-60 repeat protein